jgi:hypothetical protein
LEEKLRQDVTGRTRSRKRISEVWINFRELLLQEFRTELYTQAVSNGVVHTGSFERSCTHGQFRTELYTQAVSNGVVHTGSFCEVVDERLSNSGS